MSSEETIFSEALRKPSPHERSAFLDQACAADPQLRHEVEALLSAHDRAGEFLESPPLALGLDAETLGQNPQPLGSTVGPYKLLEQIGEGGMGIVYMAEQLHPVRRKVAVKIIKPGMDSRQVIARFEAERQALAMMDHPNIAKVFDAGTTDAGLPYFVMELVRGVPITEYCDQHQLTPRKRLELFIQVCQAVQHAHQKGIIHRDLKPTNVLVTLQDGDKPTPKVIDFGIAKATAGQRLTDRTLFTEFRQLIGTPLYTSPEQAEMSALMDVDTRSDVYSLGVLLYELLTGTTPFDKQRLAKAAYDEVRRIIREEEPPRPSTRLSTLLGATLTTVSAQRQTDPKKLGPLVRGELDWIVMRALEKDRARRYETANSFARDIERYLADQPVEACPPSRMYRLKKFARRNKAAMMTTAFVAGILVAATVVSSWQAVRATRAERQIARAWDQARAEKQRADDQATIATRAEQQIARAQDYKRAQALREEVEAKKGDPNYQYVLGYRYQYGEGVVKDAAQAMKWYRRAAEQGHMDAQFRLGWMYASGEGGENPAEAAKELRRTAARYRRELELGDPYALDNLASELATWDAPEFRDGIAAVELAEQAVANTKRKNAVFLNTLAAAYAEAGDFAKAVSIQKEAIGLLSYSQEAKNDLAQRLKLYQSHSAYHVITPGFFEKPLIQSQSERSQIYRVLAHQHARHSRWKQAAAGFFKAIEWDPDDEAGWSELALVLAKIGDGQEYRRVCRAMLANFGGTTEPSFVGYRARTCLLFAPPEEDLAAVSKLTGVISAQDDQWRESTLGLIEYRKGHLAAAVDFAKQALAKAANDRRDAQASLVMAMALYKLHNVEQARATLAMATTIAERDLRTVQGGDLGPDWGNRVAASILLGEAETLIGGRSAATTSPDGDAVPSTRGIATSAPAPGSGTTEAEQLFVRVLERKRKVLGQQHPDTLMTLYNLARLYQNRHHYANAEPLWRELGEWSLANPEGLLSYGINAEEPLWNLRDCYRALGESDKAREWERKYLAILEADVAAKSKELEHWAGGTTGAQPALHELLTARARLYLRLGKFKAADGDLERALKNGTDDELAYYYRGCVLAYLGDASAYRETCRAMYMQFANSSKGGAIEQTAKTSLLLPGGVGGDPKQMLALIERALALPDDAEQQTWYKLTKALALYRLEDFAGCAEWAQKAKTPESVFFRARIPTADVLSAMAYHRLGHTDDARAALGRAEHRAQEDLPKAAECDLGNNGGVENWLIYETLHREAAELINGTTPSTKPTAATRP